MMQSMDTARWVFRALLSSRTRSLLTALGIAIGISAVTTLTAIGEGIRHYLLESFSQFGTRIVTVTPGRSTTHGGAGLLSTIRPLSLDDARAIQGLPHIEAVVPVVMGTGRVEAGRQARDTDVLGVGPDMSVAWRFPVARGRFLPGPGLEDSRYVAVLGAKVAAELFGNTPAPGQTVRIGASRFLVVGTMQPKGRLLGFDLDDAVYIPADIGLSMFDRPGLMEIDVVFRASASSAQTRARIRELLLARHGEEDFTLFTQEDMLASLDRILGMLTTAIAAIAGVALLVGGVGVLTIMSSALGERRSEIGLLRALGATRRDVLLAFLGEAVAIALLGGLIGLAAVGLLLLALHLALPALPLVPSIGWVIASLGLSAAVGLLAGVMPALSASSLDPVEALRTHPG